MTDTINSILWVAANLEVAYIAIMLLAFSILYPWWFDPRATTAGRLILSFIFSLVGVIGLVFIAIYVDPQIGRAWFQFPGDVLWWRPGLRFTTFTFVAYTITSLVVLLWFRKFRPHKIQTAPDERTLNVKVRRTNKENK
jgi:hypothetical protein